jgi:hypothetical protein
MEAGASDVRIETCEVHGLKYNAAIDTGCVRCRRDADGAEAAPSGSAAIAVAAPLVGKQALVSALLVAGSGFLFFTAHQRMLGQLAGFFDPTFMGGGQSEIETAAAGPYNDSLAEQEVGFMIEMTESDPGLADRKAADPELRRLVDQLHDPDYRERLKRDRALRQRHFDEIDRRMYPEMWEGEDEVDWEDEEGF